MYREVHLFANLGCVDNDLDCYTTSPCCYVNMVLPDSHLPQQNLANSATAKTKPNPTLRPDAPPCTERVRCCDPQNSFDPHSALDYSPDLRRNSTVSGDCASAARCSADCPLALRASMLAPPSTRNCTDSALPSYTMSRLRPFNLGWRELPSKVG